MCMLKFVKLIVLHHAVIQSFTAEETINILENVPVARWWNCKYCFHMQLSETS